MARLEDDGHQAWCVGGAVRDALLGHPHLDWDLATDARPDDVRRLFGRKRTIPVGIDFGTVGVLDSDGVMHEVTTFRHDVRTDGRHAEVEFGASLDEDLARRDFTVNAIAFSPSRREVRDPFGGQRDLKSRVIRAVGDAQQRMREDRLRALRAMRFAARYQFTIDPDTWQAIRDSAPYLTRLSAERVKQELEKTMDQVDHPSRALRMWRETGAASVLLPELASASEEALVAVDLSAQPGSPRRPGRRLNRIAALLSDVDGTRALDVAGRLRFSNQDARWLSDLLERWRVLDEEMSAALRTGEPDSGVVRHWVARIGRVYLPAFYRLADARWSARRTAAHDAPTAQAVHSLYRRSVRAALRDPVDLRDLAIDGDDLRRAGIPPGPGMGKILSTLLSWVIEEPARNLRDRLLDEARRLHARQH